MNAPEVEALLLSSPSLQNFAVSDALTSLQVVMSFENMDEDLRICRNTGAGECIQATNSCDV